MADDKKIIVEGILKGYTKKNPTYNPRILSLHFPFYKNIKEGESIEFNFPITALVGKNGTNKTSILHALYGCPEGFSTGMYWFDTELDPVEDKTRKKARYFYRYYVSKISQDIEVKKARIKRIRKIKGVDVTNHDYWESARPSVKDGMKRMLTYNPEDSLVNEFRDKTRWNAIKKMVLYINCRMQISVFDLFFQYYQKEEKGLNRNDYIREKSFNVKTAFDTPESQDFSKKEINEISSILDIKYAKIQYLKHSYYKNPRTEGIMPSGITIRLETSDSKYSEAFAGSGEFAVAILVHEIMNAPEKSLILLDEPEISLHPGAQKRMMDFLLQQCHEKGLQIVIATHSPTIVECLPKEALKKLYRESLTNKICISNDVDKYEIFQEIEHEDASGDIIIYVEDKFAKYIIEKILQNIVNSQKITVVVYSGGADKITSELVLTHFRTGERNRYYYLDGDQKRKMGIPNTDNILDKELDQYIQKIIGGKKQVVDNGEKHPDKIKRDFINFCKEKIYFLPFETPEEYLWEKIIKNEELSIYESVNSENKKQLSDSQYYKECFRLYAMRDLDVQDDSNITSENILTLQRSLLKYMNKEGEEFKKIEETLNKVRSKHS